MKIITGLAAMLFAVLATAPAQALTTIKYTVSGWAPYFGTSSNFVNGQYYDVVSTLTVTIDPAVQTTLIGPNYFAGSESSNGENRVFVAYDNHQTLRSNFTLRFADDAAPWLTNLDDFLGGTFTVIDVYSRYNLDLGKITGIVRDLKIEILSDAATQESVDYSFNISPAIPEPSTWVMLVAGFGLAGAAMRKRMVAPLAA